MGKRTFSTFFGWYDKPEANPNPKSSLQDGVQPEEKASSDNNEVIVEQIKIMGEAIQEVLLVNKKSLEITSKKCFSNLKNNMNYTSKSFFLEYRARSQGLVIALGNVVDGMKDDLNSVLSKGDKLETKFDDLEKKFEKTTIELGELKEIIKQQHSLLRNVAGNIATIETTLMDQAEKADKAEQGS